MSSSDPEEMIIACGADDGYALHLLIMLQSLIRSQPPETRIRCYIMDGGVLPVNRAKVDALMMRSPDRFRFEWLSVDRARFAGLMEAPLLTHLSGAALLRLLLPELLPDTERILYIDSDVLVQGDLTALYETPFAGTHLVGVQDFFVPSLSYIADKEPGVPTDGKTVNSGVIVMNLARFRETGVMARAMEMMARQPSWSDQEGINAALAGDWTPAPFLYNLQTHWVYLESLPESDVQQEIASYSGKLPDDARIAHFTGQVKPWNCGYRHPFRIRYERAMRNSGWFSAAEWMQWKTRRVADYVAERLRGTR
ncbi:MAG: hypothetical protein H7Y38_19350 [Armatimonadetes bacterium]|nr:hypothetical protein [Armatimonadota bacterium]